MEKCSRTSNNNWDNPELAIEKAVDGNLNLKTGIKRPGSTSNSHARYGTVAFLSGKLEGNLSGQSVVGD